MCFLRKQMFECEGTSPTQTGGYHKTWPRAALHHRMHQKGDTWSDLGNSKKSIQCVPSTKDQPKLVLDVMRMSEAHEGADSI